MKSDEVGLPAGALFVRLLFTAGLRLGVKLFCLGEPLVVDAFVAAELFKRATATIHLKIAHHALVIVLRCVHNLFVLVMGAKLDDVCDI